jgi:hypothetical protein
MMCGLSNNNKLEDTFLIQFDSHIGMLKHLRSIHYLEVPEKVVKALDKKLKSRLICTVNGQVHFQCGLMPLGEGKAYISITKKRLKELNVKLHDAVHIEIVNDTSQYGTEMPEELEELLQQDEEGHRRFSLLKPSMQRYVLNDRAITLIENLKRLPEGKEDFRAMLGLPPR